MHKYTGVFFILIISIYVSANKYSKEANTKINLESAQFRMAKVNQLWEKALKRLSKPKLEKLMSELKIQDGEEMTLKKLKAAGGDKDGLIEAATRKKFLGIANRYGLAESYTTDKESHPNDDVIAKAQFRDKKLNKLWIKAEQSGLTQPELKALREEFQHHQERIDEYHALISKTSDIPSDAKKDLSNDILKNDALTGEETIEAYNQNINEIRTKHHQLKKDFRQLNMKAVHGMDAGQFTEPKVATLWRLASNADFNAYELDALFQELTHYEERLKKLSHLETELNKVHLDKYEDLSMEDREKILSASETEGRKILNDRLQKQQRKVDKLHSELENKIIKRHSEL